MGINRRRLKRARNRLAKKGLVFLRLEQNDAQLVTMRVILQTRRDNIGRAFVISREWLYRAPGRRIADGILADYLRGYGALPA